MKQLQLFVSAGFIVAKNVNRQCRCLHCLQNRTDRLASKDDFKLKKQHYSDPTTGANIMESQ